MGIDNIEALALILGGAFLAGTCLVELGVANPPMRVIQWAGGLAMLCVGLLDVAIDHL